ncbi:hypothetical protein P8A21_39685 (plasmid) [Streptomyces poriferorum]|uniref:hypothetical protein n=1 Tax=Streptomyces poriferorum TaxID=2798799 RepID=UPI002740227B|nr:hypothetical protein [Streptomyces sp. Alt1]WLQ53674.1 hypothetical protein P8A21_39685 [Streptomyces sp. Alt1]
MPAPHSPRRARIAFSDSAAKQLDALTSEAELHALDRALVVVSVHPNVGRPIPAGAAGPQLREYADEVEHVRLLYWVSALGTIVLVAFIEV